MIKTTLEEFREELLATGGYKTKDDHRAPFRAKPSALATLGFSYNVMRVFLLAKARLVLGCDPFFFAYCDANFECCETLLGVTKSTDMYP